jgi:hypothetical protein
MLTDACPSTLLALSTLPPVLTNAAPTTLLAQAALSPVVTDGAASTLLACSALPPMLTDACSSTLLALIAPPPVLTDTCSTTLLALATLPPVLTDAAPLLCLDYSSLLRHVVVCDVTLGSFACGVRRRGVIRQSLESFVRLMLLAHFCERRSISGNRNLKLACKHLSVKQSWPVAKDHLAFLALPCGRVFCHDILTLLCVYLRSHEK